jgi:hypothetical protein
MNRYNMYASTDEFDVPFVGQEDHEEGDWVKYEDVQKELQNYILIAHNARVHLELGHYGDAHEELNKIVKEEDF